MGFVLTGDLSASVCEADFFTNVRFDLLIESRVGFTADKMAFAFALF